MLKLGIIPVLLFSLTQACSNAAPLADAGPDQVVLVGDTVTLNGNGSTDPDGDALLHQWEFQELPSGSQAALSPTQSPQTTFTADVPGNYTANLSVNDGGGGSSDSIDSVQINAVIPLPFSGINLDYDPEVRCSDNDWGTDTPVACSPQLSFICPTPSPIPTPLPNLSGCPGQCQYCFDQDLAYIQSNLNVNTLTVYQPNYYIMTAAQTLGIKVLMGIFNDSVLALATPDSGETTCTYAGSPALCGQGAVNSLINGACGATTPWAPADFCENHCKAGSTCTNADCSCSSDSDCGGVSGACEAVAYITAFKSFFDDGTIVGIQLGNEILTSPINAGGQILTPAQVRAAAKTLRNGLNLKGYTTIPIVVSFVAGTEQDLCTNGAPPANVDGIASHPYCNDVASVPPSWPWETGNTEPEAAQACANQVIEIFNSTAVASCGSAQSFIGETGYNTGCPGAADEATHLAVAEAFFPDMVALACQDNIPLFFFDYADACPAGGCLPGCSGETNEGNGYFGIYHTTDYLTKGNVELKFSSVPTLACP